MEVKTDYRIVDDILNQYGTQQRYLITILQAVQEYYHYLPEDVLEYLAEKMDISVARIYGVATFYENFSLNPKGKYVIKICDGTACHVRKSVPILEKVREILGLSQEKQTTDDMLFTVETVSCLGACGLAPVMMINDTVHPAMTKEKAQELIETIQKEEAEQC